MAQQRTFSFADGPMVDNSYDSDLLKRNGSSSQIEAHAQINTSNITYTQDELPSRKNSESNNPLMLTHRKGQIKQVQRTSSQEDCQVLQPIKVRKDMRARPTSTAASFSRSTYQRNSNAFSVI